MDKDKEWRLYTACQQAWRNLYVEPSQSNLAFGVQCGTGWFDILLEISVILNIDLRNHPEPDFRIEEVKEKWGELRIKHFGSRNDSIHMVIDSYCEMSRRVCEECGIQQAVQLRDLGDETYKTLCAFCFGILKNRS